jgi:hypothetical protein
MAQTDLVCSKCAGRRTVNNIVMKEKSKIMVTTVPPSRPLAYTRRPIFVSASVSIRALQLRRTKTESTLHCILLIIHCIEIFKIKATDINEDYESILCHVTLFRQVRNPAKRLLNSFRPSVRMHETTRERINRFWWNVVPHSFTKKWSNHVGFSLRLDDFDDQFAKEHKLIILLQANATSDSAVEYNN